MNVRQLVDILNDYPPETEVEMAIVAPVGDEEAQIAVDRYPVEGVLPWEDDEADNHDHDAADVHDHDHGNSDGNGESLVIWLLGGEDNDVDAFMDAMDDDDD